MKILTVENDVYEIDQVPDEVDDIRFGVFDTSDPDWMDYYFLPLMPMDWSIAITDEDLTGIEVIPLTSLNNRGFLTATLNPLSGKILECHEVKITNIFQDVKWFFPKLKNGHMLLAPLEDKADPRCAMFVKEANKIPAEIDIGHLLD